MAEGVWARTTEAQNKPMLRIYTPGLIFLKTKNNCFEYIWFIDNKQGHLAIKYFTPCEVKTFNMLHVILEAPSTNSRRFDYI